MNHDTIKIMARFEPVGNEQKPVLLVDLLINGNKIEWGYIDPYAIAHHWFNHRSRYDQNGSFSVFEPFSCTCGASGCAGIWEGIYVKVRRHSVEWRIKPNTGYDSFMPKRFFSFSREQYTTERINFINYLKQVQREREQHYAGFGACPGRETPLEDFLSELLEDL